MDELAAELADLVPGSELAELLVGLDLAALRDDEAVAALVGWSRLAAYAQAGLLAAMAEVARRVDASEFPGPVEASLRRDAAVAEIGAALFLTPRRASIELDLAQRVCEELPGVHAALASGAIDVPRARAICDATIGVEPEAARRAVAEILPAAGQLTTAQVSHRLRRLILAADPEAAQRRHELGCRERRMWRRLDDDGTAVLGGCGLAPDRAAAAYERIDAMARAAKSAGDDRTLDQLRADAFLDLLDGTVADAASSPAARRGVVELSVPLTSLMGLCDLPAELAGWGPVLADIARRIVAQHSDAAWRFAVRDDEGTLLHEGAIRRRPTEPVAAFVRARDVTCRFPGCGVPARRADVDHTRAWADGGASTVDNLEVLCRRHHRLKHETGWRLIHIESGRFVWISPLGRVHYVRSGADVLEPPLECDHERADHDP